MIKEWKEHLIIGKTYRLVRFGGNWLRIVSWMLLLKQILTFDIMYSHNQLKQFS